MRRFLAHIVALLLVAVSSFAQSTNGSVLGTVTDNSGAAIVGAKVLLRNTETNSELNTLSEDDGRFRFPVVPSGVYEINAEKTGFQKYKVGPFTLRLNQAAEFDLRLAVGSVNEVLTVQDEAPLINTTTAEVSTNFEARRIADVPLATNRNMLNLALNVAGVSQLSSGQSAFASGLSFSVNGARTRSNNFLLDGQDMNDPSVTGSSQPLNNPDTVAEMRVITNQFNAEFGRSSGSVVSVVTKSGTNDFHGTGFWFNNNNALNTRSNLDKLARLQKSPYRNENFFGGTLGGPIVRNKLFFFTSWQRWWDRQTGTGSSITGAPTAEGKTLLQPFAATRPALKAVLDYLPAGVAAAGVTPETVTIGGQTLTIPRGTLTGVAPQKLDNTQWVAKVDQVINERHRLSYRYNDSDNLQVSGQATPAGLLSNSGSIPKAATVAWNWLVSPSLFTEARVSYARQETFTNAEDASSLLIPSIEVNSLGLTGFNAANSRTGIGLAVNLPQARANNTYQLQYTVGYQRGNHSYKAGIDFRQQHIKSLFLPTLRGRLQYNTLQDVVNDVAQTSQINAPLRGGETFYYNRFNDYFFFIQDEWRVNQRLTLNYGLRYESPGNPFQDLQNLNDRVVAANNNDPRYKMDRAPGRDTNNWAPRFGFNLKLDSDKGLLGTLFGQNRTVLRGGYARSYDFAFINIGLNIFSAFPFLNSITLPASTPNSYSAMLAAPLAPISNPNVLTRTIVNSDLRSPFAEQFSLNVQRGLGDWALTVGWIGTKGTALFQTIDGNPNTLIARNAANTAPLISRLDGTRGVIRARANAASSIYHSLQVSAEKRYSKNFLTSVHYTWSAFIDNASEIFNPATSGDVAVAQDSFNLRNDRGRSTYDRPHRLTTTFVYDVAKEGFMNRILPGVQFNGFLTFQSGAPFTPLNGADPFGRLSGIDSLVGNSVRPMLNSGVSLAGESIDNLYGRRTTLFSPITPTFNPFGNGLGNAGRNILRADGIGNLDLGVSRGFEILPEKLKAQLRADMYNVTNTKNFGIPESRVNSANFLNQWGTDGGNRRIQLALRFIF
jgi:hypothetical protein